MAFDEDDDGPSADDLQRFSDESARCPECGAEVWDDAERCPKCGEWISGQTSRRTPLDAWWRNRWVVLIIIILILAMLGVLPYLLRRSP